MLKEFEMQLDRLKEKRKILVDSSPATKTDRLLSFYTRIMPKVIGVARCSVFNP